MTAGKEFNSLVNSTGTPMGLQASFYPLESTPPTLHQEEINNIDQRSKGQSNHGIEVPALGVFQQFSLKILISLFAL